MGTSGSGTISNDGAINVGNISGGANLYVDATSITLSGTGTVTLNNANSYIRADGVGGTANTLVNQSTIAGQGYIYDVTLNNQGTILANVSGQTLTILIAPTTNSGTFQANSGSTLYMDGTLANYSPGTSTLTGGTYNAYSGTIELSQASKSGGDVIASNAATILLDGVTAKIADGSGNDILRGFVSSNSGSLTIQNGANLTTASTGFTNSGTVGIGANSTFTVGGSNDYVQSGGLTSLASASAFLAVAAGHAVDINGGTLQGLGTIDGNLVNNGGTIAPGLAGTAGTLTVTGNFTDPMSTLDIQLFSPTSYDVLGIGGTASLNGATLDLSLAAGFTGVTGDTYTILTSTGLSGTFVDNTIVIGNDTFTINYMPPQQNLWVRSGSGS